MADANGLFDEMGLHAVVVGFQPGALWGSIFGQPPTAAHTVDADGKHREVAICVEVQTQEALEVHDPEREHVAPGGEGLGVVGTKDARVMRYEIPVELNRLLQAPRLPYELPQGDPDSEGVRMVTSENPHAVAEDLPAEPHGLLGPPGFPQLQRQVGANRQGRWMMCAQAPRHVAQNLRGVRPRVLG